jgi:hypothetical protein
VVYMPTITSLRAFKATRSLTLVQGTLVAKRTVAALEGAGSNMLRFALAQRLLPQLEPRAVVRFLHEHQYFESDRCEACGKETRRGKRVFWSNKEKLVYACNKKCANQTMRKRIK